VHWAIPDLMHETWAQMEEAVRAGKIRAIGVCNHLEHHIDALLSQAEMAPAVNQFEFHVRLQQPGLIEYCRAHEIVAQAWAPLMRGGVSEIPEIRRIADAHGVTPIQVAIRWVLQRDISVIPKSVQPERIRSNADVYGFELSPEEVRDLDALDRGERMGRHPDNANV
jgi:diketogulonate reductase-like aldo/keto reductase